MSVTYKSYHGNQHGEGWSHEWISKVTSVVEIIRSCDRLVSTMEVTTLIRQFFYAELNPNHNCNDTKWCFSCLRILSLCCDFPPPVAMVTLLPWCEPGKRGGKRTWQNSEDGRLTSAEAPRSSAPAPPPRAPVAASGALAGSTHIWSVEFPLWYRCRLASSAVAEK